MKHLKTVIASIKSHYDEPSEKLQELIWELICYSPKMPIRHQPQQLMETATQVELEVFDQYFSKRDLIFNSFKWGHGARVVLLTHGWGSKAADFSELIKALIEIDDVSVIAFDAPGNGSSDGHLSNLFLFVEAIKKIEEFYGVPDVMIGHSLGAKASVRAIQQTRSFPSLLITIAPLVNLKENFIGSMSSIGISESDQQTFLDNFEELYGQSIDDFHLQKMYDFGGQTTHVLMYEQNDTVTPLADIEDFLRQNIDVKPVPYTHTSHAKIITDPIVISEISNLIRSLN